jgi:hypothetical protein
MREVMLDPVRRRGKPCPGNAVANNSGIPRGYVDYATARRSAPDPVDGLANSQAYGRGWLDCPDCNRHVVYIT